MNRLAVLLGSNPYEGVASEWPEITSKIRTVTPLFQSRVLVERSARARPKGPAPAQKGPRRANSLMDFDSDQPEA